MGDRFNVFNNHLGITGHARLLFLDIKAALKPRGVGGDPRGAGILVALEGLNAAKAEHAPPRRHHKIRARTKRPSHPFTLCAVKRQFLAVYGKEVLPQNSPGSENRCRNRPMTG